MKIQQKHEKWGIKKTSKTSTAQSGFLERFWLQNGSIFCTENAPKIGKIQKILEIGPEASQMSFRPLKMDPKCGFWAVFEQFF